MKLRCWVCWGSGVVQKLGARVPAEELTESQLADQLAQGGAHYRSRESVCWGCGGVGHWSLTTRRNRMNQTFSAMAAKVEDALQEYRDAEHSVKSLTDQLTIARSEMRVAKDVLDEARDALFQAHPELVPTPHLSIPDPTTGDFAPGKVWTIPEQAGGFTPIEVDDADDLPEFREH